MKSKEARSSHARISIGSTEIDSVGIRAAGPGRCGGSHRVLCLAVIELGENLAVAVVSHAPSNTKPAVLYFALWGATTHGTNDGA